MENKTKLTIGIVGSVLAIAALAWAWWPERRPSVDPSLIEKAAESSREAAKNDTPQPSEPKWEGRSRPGAISEPGK